MSSGGTRVPGAAVPRGRPVGGIRGTGRGRDGIHAGSVAEELPTTAEIAKPRVRPVEAAAVEDAIGGAVGQAPVRW
ncbi:hypothetical protein [Streptomyces sp. NPDC102476]|uniref:hypothetical protein n=1 Tax=Streptomyces sp. NPDC102476 TaxID=3366181 RepID=UPI003822640F